MRKETFKLTRKAGNTSPAHGREMMIPSKKRKTVSQKRRNNKEEGKVYQRGGGEKEIT